MPNEFTCIIEADEGWFIAYCPEIPGANGRGRTKEECRKGLSQAIALILKDKRIEAVRGVSPKLSARRLLLNEVQRFFGASS